MFKKTINLGLILCFFLTTLGPTPVHADSALNLPAPGTMVNLSPAYEPVIIRGLTVHQDNPFLFDFIVDVGQDRVSGAPLKKEGEKLIKYFLASLAIPDKDVWVNLSPYEKNKMIPEALGQTDMGRDLLSQDYILKQITASLIYPEKQLGKTFWNKVYAQAQAMFGTTQIPVNTFNKVWIMADKAEVFEHNQTAFVVGQHLKVMLEEDYLALTKHQAVSNNSHSISSQVIKQIVLPELEKEVNQGKNFANLRQIFNSIILSSWYKKNLQQALLNQVYSDKSKVKGVIASGAKQSQQYIYEQYLKAYKKGVFNYIKEDINAANGQSMPRKYFSGGVSEAMAANPSMVTNPSSLNEVENEGEDRRLVDINALTVANDENMTFAGAPSESPQEYSLVWNTSIEEANELKDAAMNAGHLTLALITAAGITGAFGLAMARFHSLYAAKTEYSWARYGKQFKDFRVSVLWRGVGYLLIKVRGRDQQGKLFNITGYFPSSQFVFGFIDQFAQDGRYDDFVGSFNGFVGDIIDPNRYSRTVDLSNGKTILLEAKTGRIGSQGGDTLQKYLRMTEGSVWSLEYPDAFRFLQEIRSSDEFSQYSFDRLEYELEKLLTGNSAPARWMNAHISKNETRANLQILVNILSNEYTFEEFAREYFSLPLSERQQWKELLGAVMAKSAARAFVTTSTAIHMHIPIGNAAMTVINEKKPSSVRRVLSALRNPRAAAQKIMLDFLNKRRISVTLDTINRFLNGPKTGRKIDEVIIGAEAKLEFSGGKTILIIPFKPNPNAISKVFFNTSRFPISGAESVFLEYDLQQAYEKSGIATSNAAMTAGQIDQIIAQLPQQVGQGSEFIRLSDYLEILRKGSEDDLSIGLFYDKTYRLVMYIATKDTEYLTIDLKSVSYNRNFLKNQPLSPFLFLNLIRHLADVKQMTEQLEKDNQWKDSVVALRRVLNIPNAAMATQSAESASPEQDLVRQVSKWNASFNDLLFHKRKIGILAGDGVELGGESSKEIGWTLHYDLSKPALFLLSGGIYKIELVDLKNGKAVMSENITMSHMLHKNGQGVFSGTFDMTKVPDSMFFMRVSSNRQAKDIAKRYLRNIDEVDKRLFTYIGDNYSSSFGQAEAGKFMSGAHYFLIRRVTGSVTLRDVSSSEVLALPQENISFAVLVDKEARQLDTTPLENILALKTKLTFYRIGCEDRTYYLVLGSKEPVIIKTLDSAMGAHRKDAAMVGKIEEINYIVGLLDEFAEHPSLLKTGRKFIRSRIISLLKEEKKPDQGDENIIQVLLLYRQWLNKPTKRPALKALIQQKMNGIVNGADTSHINMPEITSVQLQAAHETAKKLGYSEVAIALAEEYASRDQNPIEILKALMGKGFDRRRAQWFLDIFVLTALFGLNDVDFEFLKTNLHEMSGLLDRPEGTVDDQEKLGEMMDVSEVLYKRWVEYGIDKIPDAAMTPGGIDLNTANMGMTVTKEANGGVQVNVDSGLIARIQREGLTSLSPVIFSITPVTSIWPLVGLQK